jgi:hypothetical protein
MKKTFWCRIGIHTVLYSVMGPNHSVCKDCKKIIHHHGGECAWLGKYWEEPTNVGTSDSNH